MSLLDGVKQFHQLDQQFGLLLERLNAIQQQYQSQAIPHTTLRLIGEELASYISIVDEEITHNTKKSDTISDLNNPAVSADLQLLIQRLTLTKQQLQQYADHFAGLMIERPEHFEHHYASLQEIIEDETLTTKTKELVLLYVEQKKQLPFSFDLDDSVEKAMESAENHIVLHHDYLLSMTNRFEKIISQLSTIENLTQDSYRALSVGYQSPRQESYIIDSIDITKTNFQKHFEYFVSHTNDLIEDLSHINRLGGSINQLCTHPFGSGKTLQSAFFELCNNKKTFDQIVGDIKAYDQEHRIDYLVELYQAAQQLRDATYQQQPISRESIEYIVAHPYQQDWLVIMKVYIQGYTQLSQLNSLNLIMPSVSGANYMSNYKQQYDSFKNNLHATWRDLIEHISQRKVYNIDYLSLNKQAEYLSACVQAIEQSYTIRHQLEKTISELQLVQRHNINSRIKKTIEQQWYIQLSGIVHQYKLLQAISIDDHDQGDLLYTTQHYLSAIESHSTTISGLINQAIQFQSDVHVLEGSFSKVAGYEYSYLDSLSSIKKQYTPTFSNPQLQPLVFVLQQYIEQQYNRAYDRYQAAQRASSYSSINSSSSSRSSSSSSSSRSSSSSSSSSWSGSSGGWSSSGGGSR